MASYLVSATIYESENAARPVQTHGEMVSQSPDDDLHTCKTGEPPVNATNQDSEVSLCPWKNVSHEDLNRIPRFIIHAVCQCRDCHLSRLGFQDTTGESLRGRVGCREIYKSVSVFRKTASGNETCPYEEHKEQVAVGCVCRRLSDEEARAQTN